MEELLNEYGVGKDIAKGDILEGSVIGTTESEVTVNIGYRSDGIVSAEDLPEKSTAGYSEGDAIKVYVVSLDNGEGLVKLSAIKALENVIWDEFQSLKDAKSVVTVKVTEVVKGGLATLYKGYRVFVPASQIGLSFTEDLSSYVGKELEVIITDVTKEKRNVVASNRLVEKDKKQAEKLKALESLQVGDRLTGKVARLESYGAFVEIGGVDGLVHISQMSFRRIKHPSEVVTAGENVVVEIISIDKEKEKVSLKLTELKGNPWENVDERVKKGDKLTAKVLRIAPFGAFVEIEEGLEGLVHISKLSENRVENVSDVVKPGDEVTVTVISVDKDAQKISLSMREEVEKPRPEKKDRPKKSESKEERSVFSEENAAKPTTLEDLFKDKLSKFL